MLKTLQPSQDGATVVEFGLLVPVIFGSFLGVLQAGLGMMTHNSLRNLSAETSRYTLVQYQSSNELTVAQVEEDARARAAAHGFSPAKFDVEVDPVATPRIEGALEYTMTTKYKVASVLPFLGVETIDVSFTRPIFLIDDEDNSEEGSDLDELGGGTGTDFGEGGIVDEIPDVVDESWCAVTGNCTGSKDPNK